uniref:Uncharacterized protein n=1 Tax=Salix viminalis TaxID=40686 RepID=A0A6N2M4Z5_SALVM
MLFPEKFTSKDCNGTFSALHSSSTISCLNFTSFIGAGIANFVCWRNFSGLWFSLSGEAIISSSGGKLCFSSFTLLFQGLQQKCI